MPVKDCFALIKPLSHDEEEEEDNLAAGIVGNKVISAALERLSICNLTATTQKLFNAKRSRARKLYRGSMVCITALA